MSVGKYDTGQVFLTPSFEETANSIKLLGGFVLTCLSSDRIQFVGVDMNSEVHSAFLYYLSNYFKYLTCI